MDFTGHLPIMVLGENSLARRPTKESVDNKEDRHLLYMVEEQVDIVHELAQEPVVKYGNTTVINNGIGRQEFALMVSFITNMFYIIRTTFNSNIFCRLHNN